VATVAGLFRNQNDVNTALKELNQRGYGSESISIAVPENENRESIDTNQSYITQTNIDQTGAGILVTVVTEEGHYSEVKHLLEQSGAVEVGTRYGLWDRGGIQEYEEITDELREEQSKDE
jgi:hypothetical protein